ncbi:hypothetical protein SEUCBS140593_005441 [Sporothrix eucalyptigena]|uniref:DUF6546 domain-containing protein n=1 Tax=Sporothrix eucalyptigena TaxID=1812306 RepID=A0ABP0BWJ2_9PEZI
MSCFYWERFPPELRLLLLEQVAGPDPDPNRGPRHGSGTETEETEAHTYAWAPYAAVSREWQAFFERRTFASLALFNDDVEPFCAAVERRPDRLAYVGRLRLTINLPTYTCEACGTNENAATLKRNNVVFTGVLWRLLRGLAVWTGPMLQERGMQLELGVRSISDGQHMWQEYRILHPYGAISTLEEYRRHLWETRPQRAFCKYGWVKPEGLSSIFPRYRLPPAAFCRIFGTRPLVLDADGAVEVNTENTEKERVNNRHLRYRIRHNPPVAAIVQTLVVGRRFYRAIHPGTLHYLVHACFPGVQHVHLEPWRPLDAANFDAMERGYSRLLADLPPSLRRLNLFLESCRTLHRDIIGFDGSLVGPTALIRRRFRPHLGRQLAKGSNQLTVINVAFLCEAADFFAAAACLPAEMYTWPRLTTIVLTSATLAPTSSLTTITLLLRAAAAVAMRMPQLREVELWNQQQQQQQQQGRRWRRRRRRRRRRHGVGRRQGGGGRRRRTVNEDVLIAAVEAARAEAEEENGEDGKEALEQAVEANLYEAERAAEAAREAEGRARRAREVLRSEIAAGLVWSSADAVAEASAAAEAARQARAQARDAREAMTRCRPSIENMEAVEEHLRATVMAVGRAEEVAEEMAATAAAAKEEVDSQQ